MQQLQVREPTRLHNITMWSACKHTWDSRGLAHKAATIMHCKAVERIVGGKEVREKGRKRKEKSTEEAENTPENETNDTLARVYRPTFEFRYGSTIQDTLYKH